jgi:hypothetical protein
MIKMECCDRLNTALIRREIVIEMRGGFRKFSLFNRIIHYCPWCGRKLA